LNYIFYLEFSVHVLMVKQDIATEETVFAICTVGCAMVHTTVYKDLFLVCILYFIFGSVSDFKRPYRIQIILKKEQEYREFFNKIRFHIFSELKYFLLISLLNWILVSF